MMVTGYSHTVHGLKLGEIMHKNMHLLPEHLRGQFILAYRAAPKLSSQLVTYRFPRKKRSADKT